MDVQDWKWIAGWVMYILIDVTQYVDKGFIIKKVASAQMKNNKKHNLIKLLNIILIGSLVITILNQYYTKVTIISEKKKLKRASSKMIVYGKVNSISEVQKSSRKWISYNFTYKDKYYHRKLMDVFSYKCRLEFRDELFPIVIDSLHPEINFILFHPRDYNFFEIAIPKSMQWVFNCVKPSGIYWLTPAPISPDS